MLKRKRPRPVWNSLDRLFWTTLRHLWSRWSDVLVIVKPETVTSWHRAGFRLYWRWRSRQRGGPERLMCACRAISPSWDAIGSATGSSRERASRRTAPFSGFPVLRP